MAMLLLPILYLLIVDYKVIRKTSRLLDPNFGNKHSNYDKIVLLGHVLQIRVTRESFLTLTSVTILNVTRQLAKVSALSKGNKA